MAARLTDKQKKEIIADYAESGSYRATGRKFKVAGNTVKYIVERDSEFSQKIAQKKEENTADILAHMETKKETVNLIIDKYLAALLDDEKIAKAQPQQLTTALGTLIDKFTMNSIPKADEEIDPLSKAFMTLAKELKSDD